MIEKKCSTSKQITFIDEEIKYKNKITGLEDISSDKQLLNQGNLYNKPL